MNKKDSKLVFQLKGYLLKTDIRNMNYKKIAYKIKDKIAPNIKKLEKNKIIDMFENKFEIYDNQNQFVCDILEKDLKNSKKADIATAFFSVKGWEKISASLSHYKGDGYSQCRLLLGMYNDDSIEGEGEWWREDNRQKLIDKFLKYNKNEAYLKKIINQLKDKKVIIKAVTSRKLHAKLYLFYEKNTDNNFPTSCLIGSSNLTHKGLEDNGELNIHLKKSSILKELSGWFDKIWNDKKSFDISQDIITCYEKNIKV